MVLCKTTKYQSTNKHEDWHIMNIDSAAIAMIEIYIPQCNLIHITSKCSPDVKCFFLFKSYCSNLYCSLLWYDCSNNSLRKLLGIPNYMQLCTVIRM